MFKKLIFTCALLLGSVSFAQFSIPATDIEIGNTYILDGGSYPYGLLRFNIPIGSEILGSQLFLLPEGGIFFKETTSGWFRLQAVLDGPTNTVFADLQSSPLLGTQARVGIRFSLF